MRVGQIVYLLSNKDIRVFPAQVIEEINRKTLTGSKTSYVIKLPDKTGSEVNIENIDAQIFTSARDLESKMIENAKSKISSILQSARTLESVFEDVVVVEESSEETIASIVSIEDSQPLKEEAQKPKKRRRRKTSKPQNKDESKITVDLGNGMKGKIDVSAIDNLGAGSE